MRSIRRIFVALFVAIATLPGTPSQAAPNQPTFVEGIISDRVTQARLANVCVTVGPPTTCATFSDATGQYRVEIFDLPNGRWDLSYFKAGYRSGEILFYSQGTGPYRQDLAMSPTPPAACGGAFPLSGTPTQTVYLPNITKTLGGPGGWQTPFIVQNVGASATNLEVTFYRFSDGTCVTRRIVNGKQPGTSFADVPNNDADLPNDTQFSVVVRSFGASVVAVVNEHAGFAERAEAGSYVGASQGTTSVFLPNIVRRFFGFVTPFIIQNLGTDITEARADFVSFDGTKKASISRVIQPGQSQFINPNAESALDDGTQYAVTVASSLGQPISVVVNTHQDAPEIGSPVMYSLNGLTQGASPVYGPYAVKGQPGVGKGVSTIVVQNLGASAATPTLSFTPLRGGSLVTFTGPSLPPRSSWAFDPRYQDGDVRKGFCGGALPGCLADGEYSFVASASGGSLAVVVNVIGSTTAAGYTAAPVTSSKVYLPNVTRRLGGPEGWSTPLYVQSVSATNVTASWYRFSDGSLALTQNLTFGAGSAQRVDPRDVSGLVDETQYAVVLDGSGGQLAAIVLELNFQGGDGAMVYEGFPR